MAIAPDEFNRLSLEELVGLTHQLGLAPPEDLTADELRQWLLTFELTLPTLN